MDAAPRSPGVAVLLFGQQMSDELKKTVFATIRATDRNDGCNVLRWWRRITDVTGDSYFLDDSVKKSTVSSLFLFNQC